MITNTHRARKVAVTTVKKSQATITLAWFRTKVSHRCWGPGVRTGPPTCKYFSTVRGETRIPSFNCNSLAMRSSAHVTFSTAICRINCRRFFDKPGLPVGLDFQRQNSRNPLRCQRMSVSAWTCTRAPRHGNMRLSVAIIQRVESLARRGLTLRSWKSASCLRRNRFSAAKARREYAATKARRTRSTATDEIVRNECTTVRINGKPGMNAQDDTLQNVTGLQFRFGSTFCGAQRFIQGVHRDRCVLSFRERTWRGEAVSRQTGAQNRGYLVRIGQKVSDQSQCGTASYSPPKPRRSREPASSSLLQVC